MINQTRNRNESERIASRREKGGKNITEKIRCVPRPERKTVGRARGVGGGGGRSMRGAGAGRATRARACPRHGRAPPAHSQRLRRSSLVARVRPLLVRPLSRRRRPAPRDISRVPPLPRYMSKVLNSVLPIHNATVLPQPFFETEPTCTTFRVSTDIRAQVTGFSVPL